MITFIYTGYFLLKYLGVIKPKAGQIAATNERTSQPGFFKRLATGIGIKPGFQNANFKLIISIAIAVIASRLALHLTGSLGVILFTNHAEDIINSFQLRWYKADSPFYINIAQNGYVNHGIDRLLIVFYPLYPLLIRIISFLIPDYFIAGVVVSNLSLIVACVYLYKLVSLDFNKQIAWNSVKFLLIFPFSFFLGIVYSDSLFLALSVMTFYYMRKRNWFLTGLLGGLAGLTRNFGILLLIPVAIEYLGETKFIEMLKQKNRQGVFPRFFKQGLNLLLIPFGLFIYLLLNKVVTGNWFTFVTYQKEHWFNGMELNIMTNLNHYISNTFAYAPSDVACMWAPFIIMVFLIVLMVFYALGKLRVSYIAYTLVYLFICLTSAWLISGPRFLLGLFPVFIIMGLLTKNWVVNLIITFVSGLALACYTIAFVGGLQLF